MTPVTICSDLQSIFALCLVGRRTKVRINLKCAKTSKHFKVEWKRGQLQPLRQDMPCSSSARLEDLFHQLAQNFNARQLIEMSRSIFSNPFQVSGSVEMPSIFSTKGTFHDLQEKRAPWGLAENHWQSSTWPIRILYLSTMYYKECAENLQVNF